MSADPLPLRLEVLERGIEDVQTVLDAGLEIPAALGNARDSVETASWFIGGDQLANEQVLGVIRELREFITAVEKSERVLKLLDQLRIKRQMGKWKAALSTMEKELEDYREQRTQITKRLTELTTELSRIEDRVVRFDERFGERIGEEISELTDEIASLRTQLERDERTPDLWGTYFQTIQPKAERVFAEYLDLLGGVSIRERGLAMKALGDVCHLDELCALADLHFKQELTLCLDLDASFTALPGLNVASEVPPWPILRLGFASWSIWGLPLAGHEFGKLVADSRLGERGAHGQWAEELREFGEYGLRTLIADILAAWAEGPAYGCALLFLVLNPTVPPREVSEGTISDSERAALVLWVLDDRAGPRSHRGERREERGTEYLPFLEQLAQEWYGGAPPPPRPVPPPGRAPEPASRQDLLARLPERVVQRFRLKKAFELDDWTTSLEVLELLGSATPVPNEKAAGIRHLTNAAWRGRLLENPAIDSVELERRALTEGMRLINPEGDRGGPDGTDVLKGGSARQ